MDELIRDPEFVQMVLNDKSLTGPQAVKLALASGGRLPGSVDEWVARRACNIILNASTKYYEDDWCKMPEWGREFVKLNPGSHFDIEKDDQGR